MTITVEDSKKIKNALFEASGSMTRIEAEKDLIKNIIDDISKTYQLPKKIVSKMARIYHKQNFQEEQAEYDELESLYTSIVDNASSAPPQA